VPLVWFVLPLLSARVRQRVIAAGTFDPNFARNRTLLALLERAGYEVVTCQVDLWGADRYEIPNRRKIGVVLRAISAYPRLVWRFLRAPRGDVVLVMYPGWFDMLVLSLLARARRMPVVFDIFISLYDTVVSDRKLASARSVLGRTCRLVDRLSIRSAQRVIADTPSHADFFAALANISRAHVGVVWVGAQDNVFTPRTGTAPRSDLVIFYGTYVALHGLPTIIAAAKLLEADGIRFRIIGSGQEQTSVDRLMRELQPSNVELVEPMPLEALPDEIAAATLCLGIFGTSDKAHRVVPNKLYECVAIGRPVVTADTEGVRSAFSDEEVAFVAAGDPEALAKEVKRLMADAPTRESMARAAHERYVREYSEGPLSHLLDAEIRSVSAPRVRR
jgi:glycosyltransferase involved in cell wall biosynthesis